MLKNNQFLTGKMHPKGRLIIRMILTQFANSRYLRRAHLTRDSFSSSNGSRILWRRAESQLLSSTSFLELLLHDGYGKSEEFSDNASDALTARSSNSAGLAPPRSTKRRVLFSRGHLLATRRDTIGAPHEVLHFSGSKNPRPGQLTKNPSWCAHCSIVRGGQRKMQCLALASPMPCLSRISSSGEPPL